MCDFIVHIWSALQFVWTLFRTAPAGTLLTVIGCVLIIAAFIRLDAVFEDPTLDR